MSEYRRDTRTEQEFADDIAKCTEIESKLMDAYVKDLSLRTNKSYTFSDNGTDNSGKYLSDNKKITTDADFILHTPEKRNRLIEIKFSRPQVSRFHLKSSQVNSYIKQDCCIIMFMGIDTDSPSYTILTPKTLEWITANCSQHKLWKKEVYRCNNKDFIWYNIKNI